jgi:hypothetical protein
MLLNRAGEAWIRPSTSDLWISHPKGVVPLPTRRTTTLVAKASLLTVMAISVDAYNDTVSVTKT